MTDTLEYSNVLAELKNTLAAGRLKLTDSGITFKNIKTGIMERINPEDIELSCYQNMTHSFGLRLFLKDGKLFRFFGLKLGGEKEIANFFKIHFAQDMLEKQLSLRGSNWGTVQFHGSVLSFDCDKKTSFEIPLNRVAKCSKGKNEVTLEFHQDDDTSVNLMEMRMRIPASETNNTSHVEQFYENIMRQASVISLSGDAFAIFQETQCLTPRGRYDFKIYQTFFQLHGKTFDYKIPLSTILRLFLLPHKNNRQMFFIMSLDPPIRQGQTRYPYLLMLFGIEKEITIALPFNDNELQEKFEGKLSKELSGFEYEVFAKIINVLTKRKVTGPGGFVGHSGVPVISCSFKAIAGYLYPLARGFIYVHKPPIHIRFEEIVSVNFARSGGSTKSFDFEIELKYNTVHIFSNIEKEEYNTLYDFITSKKIHVKNTRKNDRNAYTDDFNDSENENEPDAYLARVKAEAQERTDELGGEEDDIEESDESTDEDFNPDHEKTEEIPEEYDSNVESSTSDSSDDSKENLKKKHEMLSEKEKLNEKENSKEKPYSNEQENSNERKKSKEKEKSNEKEKSKEKEKEKSNEKEKEKSNEKEKSREKEKLNEKEKSNENEKSKVKEKLKDLPGEKSNNPTTSGYKTKNLKKKKGEKAEGAPKRPITAFLLWLNETRDDIKQSNPGIRTVEISKKAGEIWRELKDKTKWENIAKNDKLRYSEEIKEFKKRNNK